MKRLFVVAIVLLGVGLPADASPRKLAKNRAEVLSNGQGYYKEIFMDGGVFLTSRKTLPVAPFLGVELEYFASEKKNNEVDSLLQQKIFYGSEEDRNGWLLYPDGAPRYRMIYVNGGKATNHTKSMGPTVRERINQFVKNGGSYVGTCAGAYAACKGSVMGKKGDEIRTSKSYWCLWPGYVKGSRLRKTPTTIKMEKKSPLLRYFDFGGDGEVAKVFHNGGCYAYEGALVDMPQHTEPLARYQFEDTPKVKINERLAIWGYKPNPHSGRVILCGSHPEGIKSGERLELMSSMVLYAMEGNAKPQSKGVLIADKVREMKMRAEDEAPAYTRIGDRQYHHFTVNVPSRCKRMVVSLEGYKGEDNYDLLLCAKRGEFAFESNSTVKSDVNGCSKQLVVNRPKRGEWNISVHCKTTVVAKTGEKGTYYEGDLSVLNGVPYKIGVRYE